MDGTQVGVDVVAEVGTFDFFPKDIFFTVKESAGVEATDEPECFFVAHDAAAGDELNGYDTGVGKDWDERIPVNARCCFEEAEVVDY